MNLEILYPPSQPYHTTCVQAADTNLANAAAACF